MVARNPKTSTKGFSMNRLQIMFTGAIMSWALFIGVGTFIFWAIFK